MNVLVEKRPMKLFGQGRKTRSLLWGSVLLIVCVASFVAWSILPLRTPAAPVSSTKILDRRGGVLYEIARSEDGVRRVVPLEQVSPIFLRTLVAIEDAHFYDHHGVDWLASARALKDLLLTRSIVSGASTLEQQLIKQLYFPHAPRSLPQKLREMIGAVYWSLVHTKEETLALYVNEVFFGNQAYGVEAAARTYFRKLALDLTLPESAFLVATLPSPSFEDIERTQVRARQRAILQRLQEKGVISYVEREESLATSLELFPMRHEIRAPHFVFRVLEELTATYPDIRSGGYTIRTTLDPEFQREAEDVLSRRLWSLRDQRVTNGSVVALDPVSGEVLAYVGSQNYFNDAIQGRVDMVRAKRQAGSALKPFLYFQAFQEGFTPASVISDLPVRFQTAEGKPYYPRNYGYRYHGPVTIREALGSSLNIPAVKVLDRVGLTSFVGVLSRFGLRFSEPPDHYGLGLVLGGGEVSLFEVTNAYASLALSARSVSPFSVLEVRDATGRVLEERTPAKHVPLFSAEEKARQAASLVSNILADPLARARSFGEANLLDVGKRVAVKTGTTKDFRDNWAFGYTPSFVLGVWVGNANNAPMEGVSGITGAVPIWHDLMRFRLAREREVAWPDVEGIVSRTICLPSGKLAHEDCPKTRRELFIQGTEPREVDDWYTRVRLDAQTGLAATPACTSKLIYKTFLQPPAEYDAWLAVMGYERPPLRDCEGREVYSESSPLVILSPLDGDVFEASTGLDPQGDRLPFVAGGQRRSVYRWKLNGQSLASSEPTFLWNMQPGVYTLELEGAHRAIQFRVQQ